MRHPAFPPPLCPFQVHLKHMDSSFEKVPYFCLPANDLNDVIAPSCYSCFDYTNGVADMVVRGYVSSLGRVRGKGLVDGCRQRYDWRWGRSLQQPLPWHSCFGDARPMEWRTWLCGFVSHA